MSNNFSNLHSYVSQRILSLFETLAKKYHRLENDLKTRESRKSSCNNTPAGDRKPSQLQSKSEIQSNGNDVVVNVQNHVNQITTEHETVVNVTDDIQDTSDLVRSLILGKNLI